MIFIIDTNVEDLAVKEASKLNIPIVAVVDTNSDPSRITFPIPGNDDARRAINLYCDLVKKTIIDAQQYISKNEKEDLEKKNDKDIKKDIKKEKNVKTEEKKTKKFKVEKKNESPKKKVVKTTPQKIAKSILSKVKSLATKKEEK